MGGGDEGGIKLILKLMSTNFEDSKGHVLSDNDGEAILATGETLPTDADAGYAQGCVFIHTDGTGATALYYNV